MIEKLLSKYSKAIQTLDEFKAANPEVLATLESMETVINEFANEIKLEAKVIGQDIVHKNITVKVIRRFNKYFDWNKLSPTSRNILEKNKAVSHKVDTIIFNTLVEEGEIGKETKAEAFVEKEMAPAVSIKVNKE